MKKILSRLLPVVAVALAIGVRAEAQVGDPGLREHTFQEAFKEIAQDRDEVHWYWPYLLACCGDEDDFKTFRKAMRFLKEPSRIDRAYSYLVAHHGHPSREAALEFLEDEALKAPRTSLRTAAAGACIYFKDITPLLELLLERSKDREVRAIVLAPILTKVARRGDLAALETILDDADHAQTQRIEGGLARFRSEKAIAEMLRRLTHHQTSDSWRVILMRRLRKEPGEELTKELANLLRRKNPPIQLLALEILDERGRAGYLRKDVLGLIESKDDTLCFAAIAVAGRVFTGDPRWAMVAYLLRGDEGEHRKRFEKLALGSRGSMLAGRDYARVLGGEKKLAAGLHDWLTHQNKVLVSTWGTWTETNDALQGTKPEELAHALCLTDRRADFLEIRVIPAGESVAGVLLDWNGPKDYVAATLESTLLRIERFIEQDGTLLAEFLVPWPKDGTFVFRLERKGEQVKLTVNGDEPGSFPALGDRMGLFIGKGEGGYQDLSWR